MVVATKCCKRENEVNIVLSSKNKKIVESLYYTPKKRLLKRINYYGNSIEETRTIYLERLKWHQEVGYKIVEKKEGKVIPL